MLLTQLTASSLVSAVWRTGASCRPLRHGAVGSSLLRLSHKRPGLSGLHTLRAGADGEDLQAAAATSADGKSKSHDDKVNTVLHCDAF